MRRLKEMWAVLLVLVMFAAVPVMIAGCGDDEEDTATELIEKGKEAVEDATD